MVDSFCYFYSVALRLVLKFIICAEVPMTLKSVIGQLNGIIRFYNGRKPVTSPHLAGTTGQTRRPPGSGSAPSTAPAGTGQGASLGRTQGASARVDACCRLGTQRPRRRRKPRGVRACRWGLPPPPGTAQLLGSRERSRDECAKAIRRWLSACDLLDRSPRRDTAWESNFLAYFFHQSEIQKTCASRWC